MLRQFNAALSFFMLIFPIQTANAQLGIATAYGTVLFDKATGASNGWVKSKSSEFGNGITDAVEPLINRVLTERVPVLIGQLGTMIDGNIITTEQAAERLTDYVRQTLDAALQEALNHVGHFAETVVRDKIINVAFIRARELEDKINSDLSELVTKVDNSVFCTVEHTKEAVREQVQSLSSGISQIINSIPFTYRSDIQKECQNTYNFRELSGDNFHAEREFLMWQCLLKSEHTLETPSSTISADYVAIERRARSLFCSSHNDAEGRKYYVSIIIEAGRLARVWRIAAESSPSQ